MNWEDENTFRLMSYVQKYVRGFLFYDKFDYASSSTSSVIS